MPDFINKTLSEVSVHLRPKLSEITAHFTQDDFALSYNETEVVTSGTKLSLLVEAFSYVRGAYIHTCDDTTAITIEGIY